MARQFLKLPNKLRVVLKYLCLSLAVLVMILAQGQLTKAESSSQRAQILLDRGHQQLVQGYPAAAIDSWQQAAQVYQQLHDSEGVIGSLINQSLAMQALGQYPRACETLAQALRLSSTTCPSLVGFQKSPSQIQALQTLQPEQYSRVQLLGLRNLGDVLRQLSQLEASQFALKQGLTVAQHLKVDASGLRLSLANTHRSYYKQAQDLWRGSQQQPDLQAAIQKARSALSLYQSVRQAGSSPVIATAAQLNQLNLLLDLNEWTVSEAPFDIPELDTLHQQLPPQIIPLIQKLLSADLSKLPAIDAANAHLNLAGSLLKIEQNPELARLFGKNGLRAAPLALNYTNTALKSAGELKNWRLESTAAGLMGDLYSQLNHTFLAQQQYKVALSRATGGDAPELAYQWQQRLGHLYEQQKQILQARGHYQGAVASLNQVRQTLLSSNPDFQFSFRETVEPIYKHYMRLLLDNPSPNLDQNLKEVLRVNEQLRLAELENYLQCGRLASASLEQVHPAKSNFAYFYILNVQDRYEVILRGPDNKFHHYSADAEAANDDLDRLLTFFHSDNAINLPESAALPAAQALYTKLIAPAKAYLPQSGTLVFTLDSALQQLPMGVLHDGESYLAEQYITSLSLSSQLLKPELPIARRPQVLLAGLSQAAPSFQSAQAPKRLEPLPEVATEITGIDQTTDGTKLLNEAFTRKRLGEAIASREFPIVHVATHGQFSSDPAKTTILAWDQPINLIQFSSLLRSRGGGRSALELLVLSACETAQGDKRSALGLAGVAVQAGARSTLASLWLVNEDSTPELMRQFYQSLGAGKPPAEALHNAQLALRHNPNYASPFFWAGFVVAGG